MFLDASAAIAVLAREEDEAIIAEKLASATNVLFSSLALYETTVGLARASGLDLGKAEALVQKMLEVTQAQIIEITAEIGFAAVGAHGRFGKGRHRASLNMGDCFAYALAKQKDLPLLFKGNDFAATDVKVA